MDVFPPRVSAEIEQSWLSPLEPRLEQQGGTVFRRFRTDMMEDQLLQEEAALERALENLEDELDKANAANQEALRKNMLDVKRQFKTIQHRAKTAIDLKKAETDLKVKALRVQAETAAKEIKALIEERIAEAQADFQMRS